MKSRLSLSPYQATRRLPCSVCGAPIRHDRIVARYSSSTPVNLSIVRPLHSDLDEHIRWLTASFQLYMSRLLSAKASGQSSKQPKVAPGPNEPDLVVVLEKLYGLKMIDDLANPVRDSPLAVPGLFRKAGPGPASTANTAGGVGWWPAGTRAPSTRATSRRPWRWSRSRRVPSAVSYGVRCGCCRSATPERSPSEEPRSRGRLSSRFCASWSCRRPPKFSYPRRT